MFMFTATHGSSFHRLLLNPLHSNGDISLLSPSFSYLPQSRFSNHAPKLHATTIATKFSISENSPVLTAEKSQAVEESPPASPEPIHLSRVSADWKLAKDFNEKGWIYKGRVEGFNAGGVLIRFRSVLGFLPYRELSPSHTCKEPHKTVQDIGKRLLGATISTKVIEVQEEKRKLILSEKQAAWSSFSQQVNVGDIFEARVGSVEDYGGFVHLRFPDGLYHITGIVHVSEVSWDFLNDARHVLVVADMEADPQLEQNFPLFSRKPPQKPSVIAKSTVSVDPAGISNADAPQQQLEISKDTSTAASFADLGLAEWAVNTCKELRMRKPTGVQSHCIPKILEGCDILGIAQTGSGKTAAFALPILHRLSENPFGVFALVVTPTRELAFQLAEQFRALGSCLYLRSTVIVGGMDMLKQAKELMTRPHVVIATPGRIKVLLEQDPDIPAIFARTKFLVLDEADRVLDVGFQEELRWVLKCLPKMRQTLLFSATMTNELQTLRDLSPNKVYYYEAYEGFKTVETLKQQYIFIPKNVKEVYLMHILSKMEDMGIRSCIIFVANCRTCHQLSLMLEELDLEVAALHSLKSQSLRLAALLEFKSRRVPILIATDVASRGLDIPTVDIVINYDIPRFPKDYIHRVGRTARAGRGGLAMSIITQNDIELVHEIEAAMGKKLEEFECKETEALSEITKVYKARRVAVMKMMDDGFEDKVKERKKQKLKTLAEKGLLDKRSKRRKKSKS